MWAYVLMTPIAVLNLVVVNYLYKKFPKATSHDLTYLRAKVVCSPTLAFLGIHKLRLNNIILANNLELCRTIDQYADILGSISCEEIAKNSWRYDPPKVLSDVFESVIGAILVDTLYDYEKTAVIAETLMDDVLRLLDPSMTTNPVSELLEWSTKQGCNKVKIECVELCFLQIMLLMDI